VHLCPCSAVVTGVQIHNWAEQFDSGEPNLEFVAPTNAYAVVNGQRFDIDLSQLPVGAALGYATAGPERLFAPCASCCRVACAAGPMRVRLPLVLVMAVVLMLMLHLMPACGALAVQHCSNVQSSLHHTGAEVNIRSFSCWCRLQGLTPRQIRLLASAPDAHNTTPAAAAQMMCNIAGPSTIREIDPPYMYSSKQARSRNRQRLKR
jgi:hypothetical protein